MNTIQINKIMKTDKFTKKIYLGTFARDQLPSIIKYPACFIFNNQSSDQYGEHWVALFINKKRHAEFFDSFGNEPKYYNLDKYLQKFSKNYKIFNTLAIQSNDSTFCGYYCILFCLFKTRGYSMNKFLSFFKDTVSNDKLLKKLTKF